MQLNRLQSGEFQDTVRQYLIIDCRFSYEYKGGHIREAINLSTTDDVERTLLESGSPPEPSTSEAKPVGGKTVLIFHCEFSAKRAPTRCACISRVLGELNPALCCDRSPRTFSPYSRLLVPSISGARID